ncbi:MAG TPA: prepilin-type N-terminal cleavage/methylation domain-containing protein [Gemmatimonadales bacterium]|nr:prepilin-type N-terminal cleavage/methylation domain-containing protein [Gemmatimonadales bacterium]
MRSVRSPGVTLVELLVVLALLGLVLGVSGLAIASLREPRESDEVLALRQARAEAIKSGAPRTSHGVLFLPDGRAMGPGVDGLTGEPNAP